MDEKLAAFAAKLQRSPTALVRDVAALRADMENLGQRAGLPEGVVLDEGMIGGVPTSTFTASGDGPQIVYLHGGGYVAGSPQSHRHVCGFLAAATGGTVHAPDYRLAPEARFPAAIDDSLAVWRALANSVGPMALAGDSAGGGLAFVLAQQLRDGGEPGPSCIAGLSPWIGHGLDNPAYCQSLTEDPTLSRDSLDWYSALYAPGANRADPALSPMLGDLTGLPPVLIQVGACEVLRGDAAAFHTALQAAGVDSRLQVWPDLFHAWHLFWPWLDQGRDALGQIAAFLSRGGAPD